MANGSRCYRGIVLESVSIASALSSALTIYQCQMRVNQRWQSKSNFLQLGRRMVAGHRGQFTPGGYLSTVIHTTLACIEPTTFRLLVRRAISTTETNNRRRILNIMKCSKPAVLH